MKKSSKSRKICRSILVSDALIGSLSPNGKNRGCRVSYDWICFPRLTFSFFLPTKDLTRVQRWAAPFSKVLLCHAWYQISVTPNVRQNKRKHKLPRLCLEYKPWWQQMELMVNVASVLLTSELFWNGSFKDYDKGSTVKGDVGTDGRYSSYTEQLV